MSGLRCDLVAYLVFYKLISKYKCEDMQDPTSNLYRVVLSQTGSKYKPTASFDSGNGRGKKLDGDFGLFRIKDTLNSSNIIETYNLMYVPKNPTRYHQAF